MRPREREELKKLIRNTYNVRIVTDLYAEIINYFNNNPGHTNGGLVRNLKLNYSDNAVYKAINRLKDLEIITQDNEVTLPGWSKPQTISYPLVNTIKEKVMPPKEAKWVHIASYLATCRNDEIIRDTGLTKLQYLEKVQRDLLELPLVEMMYQLQNLLAVCSLLAGNLSNWEDMNGPIYTGDIK